VIQTSRGPLTVAQVAQLVDLVSMSSDKVKVVSVTRARIVDPQNAFKLSAHFTFDSDKQAVKALFAR
jgi:hypothetical protein